MLMVYYFREMKINIIKCPECGNLKFWKLKNGRLKCKSCYHYFTLDKNKIKVEKNILRKIISEFLLEHSTNVILERINISKYKLLKILTLLRIEMTKDVPDFFRNSRSR